MAAESHLRWSWWPGIPIRKFNPYVIAPPVTNHQLVGTATRLWSSVHFRLVSICCHTYPITEGRRALVTDEPTIWLNHRRLVPAAFLDPELKYRVHGPSFGFAQAKGRAACTP